MKQVFKIGILDDDSSKVTQIMTNLLLGFDTKFTEKKEKYSNYRLEPYEIKAQNNIDNMIAEVIEEQLDCVIVDYKLSSYSVVDFSGIEFAKCLEETIIDFPVFILTSYEDDLFTNEIYNAYQVFDFNRYLAEPLEQTELHFKIIEQIHKNRRQKVKWEEEIRELLLKAGTSGEIDARIMELDTKLEKTINNRFRE